MFLNQLSEKNKELFLNLCGYAIIADNVIDPEEMDFLTQCCCEMGMSNQLPDMSEPLENILDSITKNSTNQEKNIILFELIKLFKYDKNYDEKEQAFIKPIFDRFGISIQKHDDMALLADRYIKVYNDIADLLNQ